MRIEAFIKYVLFAIVAQSFFLQSFAQTASPRTQDVFSQNKKYHVRVTGLYYEGFVGDQKITLINSKGDTLWTQFVPRRFLILPSVSNNGDVAITHREINIFDKYKRLKGTLSFNDGESPYHEEDYEGTVHGFSVRGDRYFIFIRSPDDSRDVILLCLTDSAKSLWSKNLGYYMPVGLFFYKDKLIVHDCGNAGVDYTNYCYVFNIEGIILWQYQTDSKSGRDWKVTLDPNAGTLIVIDKSNKIKVKLDGLVPDRH